MLPGSESLQPNDRDPSSFNQHRNNYNTELFPIINKTIGIKVWKQQLKLQHHLNIVPYNLYANAISIHDTRSYNEKSLEKLKQQGGLMKKINKKPKSILWKLEV